MSTKALTIYDAAAGAGKTYTLVKNYLLKVLGDHRISRYQQILAITFTNKAVSEMKERILSTLYSFALDGNSDNAMFQEIQKELQLETIALQQKSLEVLHYILHNYTAFSVQTIDKFTQSIIRTFAFDLNLSTAFEVQLDQKAILEEAVDQLLLEVGKDKLITKVVMRYVNQQINDDKSWDIKRLLIDLGMLLFQEEDQKYLELQKDHTIADYVSFEEKLKALFKTNENEVKKSAELLIQKFQETQVIDDFIRGSLPNYFKKLANEGTFPLRDFILKDISQENLYAKSKSDNIKQRIDQLRPEIEKSFEHTKALIYENKLIEGVVKNLPAISLLSILKTKIDLLKKEKNQVLISEFNALIAENIKDQPTPFIYERLGEKYKDFFIDEFQDTSEVQWDNLIPLIDNSLSSFIDSTETTGTATLVGDAKQSIYRWRGGKAEQFIHLSNGNSPFSNSENQLFHLGTNYRSCEEIIKFNNDFFSYLCDFLSNDAFKSLYKKGNQQKTNSKDGGYISFECFEANLKKDKDEIYPEAVEKYIAEAIADGFEYKDIAVLVRRNAEGVTIANYLSEKEIPVISTESLLIKNALEIQLLEAALFYLSEPDNENFRLKFINALYHDNKITYIPSKIASAIKSSAVTFNEYLYEATSIDLKEISKNNPSVFQLIEKLMAWLNLNVNPSANLQFFLDIAFDYTNTHNGSIQQFLEYWVSKKDKLSVVSTDEQNGVKVMTIHKSKGLEFPIVILPYLSGSLYDFKPKNLWIKNIFEDLNNHNLYWQFNRKVFDYYNNRIVENSAYTVALEELDLINVLYVAFTRAVNRLYLIGNEKEASTALEKGNIISFLNDFFSQKNLESNEINRRSIGKPSAINKENKKQQHTLNLSSFHYKKLDNSTVNATITNEIRENAIKIGDFIHLIMSKIYDKSTIDEVFAEVKFQDTIPEELLLRFKSQIEALTHSKEFENCFNKENTIFNERDFYMENEILRPDRIEISADKTVYILDYKTGEKQPKHKTQIKSYDEIVKKLGYRNVKNYLIYFDEILEIVEVK